MIKRIAQSTGLLLLAFSFGFQGLARAGETSDVDWDRFSENLVVAINSDNTGLQQSALQQIIENAEHLSVYAAAPKLVEIYRKHHDLNLRKMALVTIYATDNKWAFAFIKEDIRSGSLPELRNLMIAVLNHSNQKLRAELPYIPISSY